MSNKLIYKNICFILYLALFSSIHSKNYILTNDSIENHIFQKQLNSKDNLYNNFDDDDDDLITKDKNCNMTEYPEQAEKCDLDHMECKDMKYYHHCSCKDGYITYPINNTKYCNLEQKKQSIAFTLELCVGFGAGHFYRHDYTMGALKLVAFVLGLVFICFYPLTARSISECDCDCLAIFLSIIYYLYVLGLAFWYIWDLVFFGKNKYMDLSYENEKLPLKHW